MAARLAIEKEGYSRMGASAADLNRGMGGQSGSGSDPCAVRTVRYVILCSSTLRRRRVDEHTPLCRSAASGRGVHACVAGSACGRECVLLAPRASLWSACVLFVLAASGRAHACVRGVHASSSMARAAHGSVWQAASCGS